MSKLDSRQLDLFLQDACASLRLEPKTQPEHCRHPRVPPCRQQQGRARKPGRRSRQAPTLPQGPTLPSSTPLPRRRSTTSSIRALVHWYEKKHNKFRSTGSRSAENWQFPTSPLHHSSSRTPSRCCRLRFERDRSRIMFSVFASQGWSEWRSTEWRARLEHSRKTACEEVKGWRQETSCPMLFPHATGRGPGST